jgi:hypothetical protein
MISESVEVVDARTVSERHLILPGGVGRRRKKKESIDTNV